MLQTQLTLSYIAEAYAADPTFADDNHTKRWMFFDNLWWGRNQNAVPQDQEVKLMVLQESPASPYAGHLGVRKTVKKYCIISLCLTLRLKLNGLCSIVLFANSTRATIKSRMGLLVCSQMRCHLTLGMLLLLIM